MLLNSLRAVVAAAVCLSLFDGLTWRRDVSSPVW